MPRVIRYAVVALQRAMETHRTAISVALGVLAIAALVWSSSVLGKLQQANTPLATSEPLMQVALAANKAQAQSVLQQWRELRVDEQRTGIDVARTAVKIDNDSFVPAYVAAGILICLAAAFVSRSSPLFTAFAVLCFLVAAVLDVRENSTLNLMLDMAPSVAEHVLDRARAAAIGKFVAVLVGIMCAFILLGAALRRLAGTTAALSAPDKRSFEQLINAETTGVFSRVSEREKDAPRVVMNKAADEPRVGFRSADVIGLAFSGGGIRSATFNLGLLEGMHRRKLLELFDYLSTVSGGGYVGAFWSEYLTRRALEGSPDVFPSNQGRTPGVPDQVDSPQARHLREFSKFLAPRWGFFEVEMWTAIVALLSGLVPALAIALGVIGLALIGWLALAFPLALPGPQWPALVMGLITAGIFVFFERMWHTVRAESAGRAGTNSDAASIRLGLPRYFVFATLALATVIAAQLLLPGVYQAGTGHEVPLVFRGTETKLTIDAVGAGRFEQWWSVIGAHNPYPQLWLFSPRLFDYTLVWLAVGSLFIVGRLSFSLSPWRSHRETLAAYDRVLMRMLGAGVFWLALALVWHLVINLAALGSSVLAASGLASGGLFAALRNWIGVALRRPNDSRLTTRIKPYLPQVLAYLTIVVAAVLVGQLLYAIGGVDWFAWWKLTALMMTVAVIGLFIDPTNYGLHAFYRERLSRAYTGASNIGDNEGAEHNRATEPRRGDDRRISELVDRPLHLVCCAANDLSGDTVQTLGRGARSAVLSKFGLSLGAYWTRTPEVRLGSAITASAAAFNSNMGMVSMRVGPAVSFLMTALNLRLGLWLRHPAARVERFRRWPGLLIYREMFGMTSSSGRIDDDAAPRLMRDIHLSDGAHFENLALYELVRRHCRYILVSDCGSDPTVSFDDLGNALRRIREDFGIDISIDVSPLKPDATTGLSKQHVAIGTVHYSDTDQGILLYIKPTLTGDEPPDVGQYKTRNAAFPHETTADQFYDEAQYESYRRLGIHAAECVFEFVPPNPEAQPAAGGGRALTVAPITRRTLTADWVFVEAFHRWGATPPGLAEKIVEMTGRVGALEMELQQENRLDVLQELFPELWYVDDAAKALNPHKIAIRGQDLPFLLRMTQIMEDVWIACELDTWWEHPLNLGWVNLFARWATSPSFRFWWPIFAPMYSPGFRTFINDRFPTPPPGGRADDGRRELYVPQRGRVIPVADNETPGLAETWWSTRATQPVNRNRIRFQNMITLPTPGGAGVELQAGIAALATAEGLRGQRDVGWTSDDFFVPPSLWGAGIGWHFLVGLLSELTEAGFHECYVVVKAVPHDAQHRFAFDDQHSFIKQYRKVGFRQETSGLPADSKMRNERLLDALGFRDPGDTLFKLNLPQWHKRRMAE